jgi:hypothetical protein
MNIKCAWCKKSMGSRAGLPGTDNDTTHGICADCREKQMKKAREALEKVRL